jgi:hypothetical protein
MSRTNTPGQYVQPIKSDGTLAVAAGSHGVYTLSGSSTYYAEINTQTSPTQSIHLQWSAALAATITVETSDFAVADAATTSSTAGDWVQQNPSSAYVPVVGSGNSASALTITAGGSAAGAAQINLAGLGSPRLRVKIVVTTGGTIRIAQSGKE